MLIVYSAPVRLTGSSQLLSLLRTMPTKDHCRTTPATETMAFSEARDSFSRLLDLGNSKSMSKCFQHHIRSSVLELLKLTLKTCLSKGNFLNSPNDIPVKKRFVTVDRPCRWMSSISRCFYKDASIVRSGYNIRATFQLAY